ncbi:sulfotransferase family protein [Vibrio brasiliensis]|uniref:sulfotransferase family protein n=1 Tax=Vibrio brasiliensis TaxID=170652 RepID=UPI001EFD029C|nr:sulfotransferase [Vibrio brasiliensis]MCG9723783.1 sulfotransferase [Vibrio brasiliensis]
MLVLIGNSPSSGSTLLSELLDSTPISLSGEELGLFACEKFYNDFDNSIHYTSSCKSLYISRIGLFSKGLQSYGLTAKKIKEIADEYSDPKDFVAYFLSWYKEFRGRDADVIFEKTPQNLSCIGEFLDTFPDCYFIHIVRNPVNVFLSLLKRGFPPYIAAYTWLLDVANFYKYREHKRVINITYEDLTNNPYESVSEILKKVTNKDISPDEIEKMYKGNTFRAEHTLKIDSWSNKKFGSISNNHNKSLSKEQKQMFCGALNGKISDKYAKKFGVPPVSYLDMINYFGYGSILNDFEAASSLPKSAKDYKRLLSRFYHDFKTGDANIKDVNIYLNPIKVF